MTTDLNRPLQFAHQLFQRLGAMADAVFVCGFEFRAGFAESGQKKIRIVAEAVYSARAEYNFAVPGPFGEDGFGIVGVAQQGHHAIVMSVALGLITERANELFIIARIGFRFAGVTGGMHTGLAIERIDANAGVIRQDR